MVVIGYKELLHRQREIERIQRLGVELVYKKDMIKIVIGSCMVGVGLVTLPFPTGSVVLISVGSSLVVSGGINLYKYNDSIVRKVRVWGLKW